MRVKGVTPHLADLGGGKNLLFVKVETEGGPHGWGECYTQADRDASIVAHVEGLGRYLVGRDASHITHFVHMAYNDFAAKRGAMDFWSAVSGLEQALWDIAGKRHGVPVHELLGGACRERIRVYANGWYGHGAPADYAAAGARDGGRGLHRAEVRSLSRARGAPTSRAKRRSRRWPRWPPCARPSVRRSIS